MLYHAVTLIQLRQAIDGFIKKFGENAFVGGLFSNDAFHVDPLLQIYAVYVDRKTSKIVGTESDDYQPKEGECAVVIVE